MDRISALRNVEDALAAFEAGDLTLADLEERVLVTLRTYATEFEEDADLAAYRAYGDEAADGVVVVAADRPSARDRIDELLDAEDLEFELEQVG